MTDNEFIKANEKLAYSVASSFFAYKQADMDIDDIKQMALIYLWEAKEKYDKERGTAFSTFAVPYIRCRLIDHFKKLGAKKNAGYYDRVDLSALTEDGETDGYETLLAAPENNTDSLDYNMLRWDVEMHLVSMKRKENRKESLINRGIGIIEHLVDGEEAKDIKKKLKLGDTEYKNCLAAARGELKLRLGM